MDDELIEIHGGPDGHGRYDFTRYWTALSGEFRWDLGLAEPPAGARIWTTEIAPIGMRRTMAFKAALPNPLPPTGRRIDQSAKTIRPIADMLVDDWNATFKPPVTVQFEQNHETVTGLVTCRAYLFFDTPAVQVADQTVPIRLTQITAVAGERWSLVERWREVQTFALAPRVAP